MNPGDNSIKISLQVYLTSWTLVFLQIHTHLNSIKVFTSSRYKPPTRGVLLNLIFFQVGLYMRTLQLQESTTHTFCIQLIPAQCKHGRQVV